MAQSMNLRKRVAVQITPTAPFNFDATAYKPSHFPSSDNSWTKGAYWFTLNFQNHIYGIRLENLGDIETPRVLLTIYCDRPIEEGRIAEITREVKWRFDMETDISGFYDALQSDILLEPILHRWKGMRASCQYSLYELIIITIVLQNATVRRSVQMMEALLRRYGTSVRFDQKELNAFWRPDSLTETSEDDLRKLKVGYRARSIKRISDAFARLCIDESKLRTLATTEAKSELMKLYGIGPASVGILLFEALHRYDAFDHISPWEQKIYSHLLFNSDLVPPGQILEEVGRRWGRWKMLAAHYIFEDLFWRNKNEKVPWLEELIKL